jgi:4-alpha-glucanotransferase
MRSTTCEAAPPRRAGVLLHATSLPGGHGVGDLGPGARRFLRWLSDAGQRLWQVLPLAPTGYGDSPYAALSAFAGNPLLVSLEDLVEEGWLEPGDLADAPRFEAGRVDYARVAAWKGSRLALAARRFATLRRRSPYHIKVFAGFRARTREWLGDFALYLALKERHGGRPWFEWDGPLARREEAAVAAAREALSDAIGVHVFAQYCFDLQWSRLRREARELGIELMGDLPIYLAHDSAEVWARRELFQLREDGRPRAVAGVPPDYFSADGQLWGNPLHDWPRQAQDGYAFWVDRLRCELSRFDLVRLDHFRGFEAYWEVPAGAPTAAHGRWVKGPGAALFERLEAALGRPLPLVAENLGVITPEVEALRRRFGFPGMAILQFAFGNEPQAESFKPHNWVRNLVAYTGTHDNDTVAGWWASEAGPGSTRSADEVRRERAHALAYLGSDGRDLPWTLVRTLYASVAARAVTPLQDLLGLGREARMNLPATASGNWRWRAREEDLAPALAERARALAGLYGRSPGSVSSNQ